MNTFSQYADYYDLMYKDKDYLTEAKYISNLIKKYQTLETKKILELGCGTGEHAIHLVSEGFHIQGIDLSEQMIEHASFKYGDIPELNFTCADAKNYQGKESFDAVLSLFHVASYQTEDFDLYSFIENAYDNLNPNGLFIFDFWYGPAVLEDPPTKRSKTIENEFIKVLRNASPETGFHNNYIINYDIEVLDKIANTTTEFHEAHNMRYLFYPELKELAEEMGFKIIANHPWLDLENELSAQNWNGVLILKR